jgi:hypothetical protein
MGERTRGGGPDDDYGIMEAGKVPAADYPGDGHSSRDRGLIHPAGIGGGWFKTGYFDPGSGGEATTSAGRRSLCEPLREGPGQVEDGTVGQADLAGPGQRAASRSSGSCGSWRRRPRCRTGGCV